MYSSTYCMKRLLLLFLFMAITAVANAQMSGDYNYSIGLRAYSLMQMPKIMDESGSAYFTNTMLNGVLVKFNSNQISFRLNGTYYNNSKRFFNSCETCEEANGKLVDYSLKFGFEKSFNYARIQPYFAIDLGYRSNAFTGEMENRNDLKAASSKNMTVENVRVEASKVGGVLSPVLGLKINVAREISIFAEGSLDFFYNYERRETTSLDATNTRTLNKYYKSDFLLNPVSIGVQVHLGSNK
jgi:hypothetical protein